MCATASSSLPLLARSELWLLPPVSSSRTRIISLRAFESSTSIELSETQGYLPLTISLNGAASDSTISHSGPLKSLLGTSTVRLPWTTVMWSAWVI